MTYFITYQYQDCPENGSPEIINAVAGNKQKHCFTNPSLSEHWPEQPESDDEAVLTFLQAKLGEEHNYVIL